MPLSFGFLSPYPPRQDGLDAFTRSLADQLAAIGHRTGVVRMVDVHSPRPQRAHDRAAPYIEDVHARVSLAVAALATFDVAVVQFEFGFQHGIPAAMVSAVADRLTVPVIVVAHAAHTQPTSQRENQAVQLLSAGAGIIVPHDDPLALIDALRRVLTQPDLAATMSRRAIETYPERAWPAVARRYQRLAQDVAANRLPTAV